MNIFWKRRMGVVGLLMIATTAFSAERSLHQKEQKSKIQPMMPGYNASARIDVRGQWDVFANAGFVFWQLSQDNMEVAVADSISNSSYTTSNQIKGNGVQMDFDYKPGFVVGVGTNSRYDGWDTLAEYTRIHTSNSASTNGATVAGSSAPLFSTWGNPYVISTNAYNTASEHWHCNLDIINADLGRVYYVGAHLTFRPFFGARSVFLTQNVHAHYVNSSFANGTGTYIEVPGILDVYTRNRSWSIGPRIGVNTNWGIGQYFRFFGNANADVLYTKYKVQNKTTFIAKGTVSGSGISLGQHLFYILRERVIGLRPHLDLEMGFGWGSYFANNSWHIDVSAAYGYQVFFNQNMLTTFFSREAPGNFMNPSGNLYAQGLTTTARLDF